MMFELIQNDPQLSGLAAEAQTLDAVAEHSSELHRSLWHYMKAKSELESNPDDVEARWICKEMLYRMATQSAGLSEAVTELKTEVIAEVLKEAGPLWRHADV